MEKQPQLLKILNILTPLTVLIAAGMVFLYAPVELVMGQVQKIFYFHVAANWAGMLSLLLDRERLALEARQALSAGSPEPR